MNGLLNQMPQFAALMLQQRGGGMGAPGGQMPQGMPPGIMPQPPRPQTFQQAMMPQGHAPQGLPSSAPTPGGVPPAMPLTPGMGAAPAAAGPLPVGGGNPLAMMGMAGGLGGLGGGSTTTPGGGGGGNRNWLGAMTDPARAATNRIAPGLHPLGPQGGGDMSSLLRMLGGF